MSRVGKLPVKLSEKISVKTEGNKLTFSNGKDEVEYVVGSSVEYNIEDNVVHLVKAKGVGSTKDLGMHRSNIDNIVRGLNEGFKVVLEVNGVGYKASVKGKFLVLSLGFSHDIFYAIPEGINIAYEKPNLVVISGYDKVKVGQVGAEIIAFRKPEPYKGKGVKIQGQPIVRKEGKKK